MAPVTGAAVLAQLPLGRGSRGRARRRRHDRRDRHRPRFGVRRARTRSPRLDEAGARRFLDRVPRLRPRPRTSSVFAPASLDDLRFPDLVAFARYDAALGARRRRRRAASSATARPPRCSRSRWRARASDAPRRALDRVESCLDSGRVRPRGGRHPRAARRGRVLPGEPHPPAHADGGGRSRRAVRRARARRTRRRTPRCCTFGPTAAQLAVVSASPELFLPCRRPSRGDATDQGHRADARALARRAPRTAPRT